MAESFFGFRELMVRVADALKAALFPTKCLICKSFFSPEVQHGSRSVEGLFQDETLFVSSKKKIFEVLMTPYLCGLCSKDFLPVESPFCLGCGIMFKTREGQDHFCAECLKFPKRFKIARSAGIYDHALMAAIHLLKYRGKIQLARPLGMLLFSSFIDLWEEKNIDLVIPVPLHVKRLKKRGFNPSFLLVKDWFYFAQVIDIELSHMHIAKNLLVRNRWTEPQTGLDRKKRLANIKNAFGINGIEKMNEKRILLVDDVYTTGATVDECSKVLMNAGAMQVDVLTLARAM